MIDQQETILRILRMHGDLTAAEISYIAELPLTSTEGHLRVFRHRGIVKPGRKRFCTAAKARRREWRLVQ